ncbi:MAG TPA: hypothetical protein V6C65_05985 [Allocoleopsis sp.]
MSHPKANAQLLEAVARFKTAELEAKSARIELANAIETASKNQPMTLLSQLTGINRTTLYWLMNNWRSDSENSNRNH